MSMTKKQIPVIYDSMSDKNLEGCTFITLGPKVHYKEDVSGRALIFEDDDEIKILANSIFDFIAQKGKFLNVH